LTQDAGCRLVYDPKGTPYLYVNHASRMVCRVPFMPCFLDGNSHNTLPHSRRNRANAAAGLVADSQPDSGTGSLLYEINMWLWRFGRPRQRALSVSDAEDVRAEAEQARTAAAANTRQRRRAAAASRRGQAAV
jgi:hypothetical protein